MKADKFLPKPIDKKKDKEEILNYAYYKKTNESFSEGASILEIKYKRIDSAIVSVSVILFFMFLALFLVLFIIRASIFIGFSTIIYTHLLPIIAAFTSGYVGAIFILKILSIKYIKIKEEYKLKFIIKIISALLATFILLLIILF